MDEAIYIDGAAQILDAQIQPGTDVLTFSLHYENPSLCYATITIAQSFVNLLYHQAALSQQRIAHTSGFNKGQVPLAYIKTHYKEHLLEHIKEFLLKYCIINFLFTIIRENKILVGGDPRLLTIAIDTNNNAEFCFELTVIPPIAIYEWRYLPFKAPKRKNYRDLDRQVEFFLNEEKLSYEKAGSNQSIIPGDWVNFDLQLLDNEAQNPIVPIQQNFWLRIGEEEIETPLGEIFFNKHIGDVFSTQHKALQIYFSSQLDTDYHFRISIQDILPFSFFCFEQFKRHFRLKTNKEMHQKLIEVFSYRNDISQRRSMVEESLKLMLSKHSFTIPTHFILRQQKVLLEKLYTNPDYQVYRMQKDFQIRVQQLAEKQAREAIFIDQIAYNENINLSHIDVKAYLNLNNRARMKEFVYFEYPLAKMQGQDVPLPTEEIKRICLREKTINYIIYHLTKN